MKRRTKILFAFGLAVMLPVAAIFCLFGYRHVAGEMNKRNFLAHNLNREVFALNPSWNANIQDIDVTSKFPREINEAEFKTFLELIGYKCGQGNVCSANAGYNLACISDSVIIGRFDVLHKIVSAKVRYNMTCLYA